MPLPAFAIDLSVSGSPAEVWERLWDLDRHTDAVPLTVVSGGPLDRGARFVGRTRLGPLHVDDVMVVREWEPPHRCVVEKVGRPLGGRIEATLEPAPGGTRLRWRQRYEVTGLPDRLVALARPAVRAAYLLALRRITRP
ncbi:SRPBCC family protein [Ornithinimicrobium tianjinense]|uniref:Polyketide cyclase / dehydrase and lipid transport n=1 Tax=Ornithinimicrobium tianjinense TaxID=1195761 RepID=A0A917BEL6_9MICO|nr:SRPBCC family protein [Ornithinimicrobium tianjinense]GGF36929.1 hypothetical protein GCM10011366_00670 [Ornithinimicrobium tianjinense]